MFQSVSKRSGRAVRARAQAEVAVQAPTTNIKPVQAEDGRPGGSGLFVIVGQEDQWVRLGWLHVSVASPNWATLSKILAMPPGGAHARETFRCCNFNQGLSLPLKCLHLNEL